MAQAVHSSSKNRVDLLDQDHDPGGASGMDLPSLIFDKGLTREYQLSLPPGVHGAWDMTGGGTHAEDGD
ncbi:MAG TPA: hypothetical protein VL918_09275 [Sphingobium sp.]|nr:hypothetical protein [Sphingobium sp.]